MIKVLDGGLSSTVQDDGRYGQYHIGMPLSGAMDGFAHSVANALVGNNADRATIEMTYQGFTLRFEESTTIALTGAEMAGELDGVNAYTPDEQLEDHCHQPVRNP